MENKIEKITAEEIKDSRGNPTLKVRIFSGSFHGSFSVPSGASTGIHEANELRDNDMSLNKGLGVRKAILSVEGEISKALLGKNITRQREIDEILINLDGTGNKRRLGGNSIVGVSIACAKAAAKVSKKEVFEYLQMLEQIKPSQKTPYLYMNLINGGLHAKNNLAFQEYHVVPMVDNASEALEIGIKIQESLKEIILSKFGQGSVILGDEGGFAPKIENVREPLFLLTEAIEKGGYKKTVRLALDVAATSFFEDGIYKVNGKKISSSELAEIYSSLISEFSLLSIEDPFHEEDFENFRGLKNANEGLYIVGDDLTVTNIDRLKIAIEKNSINAMIVKPNQIGTLSETLQTMKIARENGINLIVSHRSGETDDDFIADLAYAFGCFGFKSGAPQKAERRVKYDRLAKISKK